MRTTSTLIKRLHRISISTNLHTVAIHVNLPVRSSCQNLILHERSSPHWQSTKGIITRVTKYIHDLVRPAHALCSPLCSFAVSRAARPLALGIIISAHKIIHKCSRILMIYGLFYNAMNKCKYLCSVQFAEIYRSNMKF